MATTQTFETIIRLNSEEAKNKLEQLRKKVDDLKAARDKAIQSKADSSFIKDINKDLKAARSELRSYETNVSKTIDTVSGLANSSVKDIKQAMRALKQEMDKTSDPEEYAKLQQMWERCRQRVDEFKSAIERSDERVRSLNATLGNLGGSSLNELTKASSTLQAQLAGMNPQSDAYGQKAAQLATVRQRIEEINASQKAANTTFDKYNKEIEQATGKVSGLKHENELIDRTLKNISGSTMRDLEYSLKLVNEQLRGTKQGTEEYDKLVDSAKRLKTQMAAVNDEQKASRSLWSRGTDWLNANWGAVTQILGAVTGLSVTLRKCTNAFAEMNQEMYNVTKYTGQTIQQVEEMNEDFKKLDTRTSRIELNQLAEAAGRLGIQSKEQIEEFVDAADKINVALGDDLGKGAVDKIGKLATMFGESDRMGLRGAMLATGSAVNDLAQSSSANAGYIVDFTADLSGVASQANMTQAQIMGLASALDQNMQEEATSATVFSQLITKMFQDPAKFAKLAGQEVQKFTDLLNTNANEAMLTFMQSMADKGGFDALAPMFSEMGLEGTRAVGVLSAVASHLDQVREAQQTAAQSYKEGTSVINEFNVQNQTVQAELDKAKKAFNDLCVDLGEKLLPIARYAISSTSLGVKVLYQLTMFVSKHADTIALLAIAYAACVVRQAMYNANSKISIALDTVHTTLLKAKNVFLDMQVLAQTKVNGTNALAIKIQKELNASMLKFPGTWIVAAIAAVGIGYYKMQKWLMDDEAAARKLNEQLAAEKKRHDDNRKAIEKLLPIAQDEKKSHQERTLAINELKRIMPDYFKKLDTETAKQYDLADALSAVNKQYKDKVKNAYLDAKINYEKVKSDYDKNHPKGEQGMPAMMPGATGTPWAYQGELRELNSAKKKFEAAEKAYNDLNKPAAKPQKTNRTQGGGGNGGGNAYGGTGNGGGSSNGTSANPKDDKYKKESDALKKHLEEEQLALSQQLQGQKIAEEDYESQTYAKKQKYYSDLLALQTKYGKDTTSTQQAMVDASMAEAKRLADLDEQHMKEQLDTRLRAYNEEQMALVTQRTQGKLTEDEYNEKLKQAEILYHRDRLSIIQEYGGDELEEQKWLLNQELDDVRQTEEEKRKARLDMLDHRLETADTYDGQRAVIQKMYDEQLITYEEYQDKMTQIAQQKAQARQAVMQQAFDTMNQMLSAVSQYSQACSDLEVARITANYDKQIEAAGNNSRKKKKLEEKRDKEIAAAKKKANKRAMVMEMAQAVASTALAAINAYSSAAQVPYVGYILAPIAAATATAAGMLQIATIKKQHQTEEATGYYEGGFTGGRRYRQEAGVVHEGEFVANHNAVANQRILPALQLIDQAQRNNTVGRLTEADVSRALGQSATVVSAPSITVNSDNSELRSTLTEASDVIDRLSAILASGIHASVSIDGEDGVAHQLNQFNKMKARK